MPPLKPRQPTKTNYAILSGQRSRKTPEQKEQEASEQRQSELWKCPVCLQICHCQQCGRKKQKDLEKEKRLKQAQDERLTILNTKEAPMGKRQFKKLAKQQQNQPLLAQSDWDDLN